MEVFKAIQVRRSIRKYQNKPVEEDKLNKILEAGRLAPSACNLQPTSFVVVKEPAVKEKLSEAYTAQWFAKAPVVIVACADPAEAWRRTDGEEFWKVDAAIALQTMMLQATEEGLGTCWIGAFDEKKAKEALGIPANIRVVALMPLGYAAESKGVVKERKPLHETVHNDYW